MTTRVRDVDAILQSLAEVSETPREFARSMPSAFYTSPEFLELEKEQIFRQEWICLGHAGEIPQAGDFFATDLVDEPLLVVRTEQNTIAVFSNVCRHRGNLIAQGKGNRRKFTCGYHAWTYDLDGSLLHAPWMDEIRHFDKSHCGLKEFRSEIFQNFVFVNLGGNAPSLASRLETLLPHIKNYHNEERHLYFSHEETWKTNWKCLAENFMEGYHLTVTHPKTLHPYTPTSLCEWVQGGEFYSAYKAHYNPTSPQREPHHPDLTAAEKRYSFLFSIFPSFVVTYIPHITMYLCLRPISVDEVAIRWGISGHKAEIDQETRDTYYRFANEANAEDRLKLEMLQKGLKSRHYTPGPLAPANFEGTIWDFYNFMARCFSPSATGITSIRKADTESLAV